MASTKEQKALEAAQSELAKAHEVMAKLQADHAQVVAEAADLEARIQRPPTWGTVQEAADDLEAIEQARKELSAREAILPHMQAQIDVAQSSVLAAETAVQDAHADIMIAERDERFATVSDAVRALHGMLDDFYSLNAEIVRLGRQADNTFKLLRVPVIKTSQALDTVPKPKIENPHKEIDRLQKHLAEAQRRLTNAEALPARHLERDYHVKLNREQVKNLSARIEALS